MNPVLQTAVELAEWQQVPRDVARFVKEGSPVVQKLRRVIKGLPHDPGYGYVFWHPTEKKLWAVLGDSDDQATHNRWANALKTIPGVQNVKTEAETHPPGQEDWIRVKTAADAPFGLMLKPFEWEIKLAAAPLTNAIAGGLLAGGLGYGAGALVENMMPERYVERGKLRKTLGLLGLGGGALPGLWQAHVNSQNAAEAGKPLGFLGSLTTPNEHVPINQAAIDSGNHLRAGWEKQFDDKLHMMEEALRDAPLPSDMFLKAAAGFAGAGANDLRSVPMDAFNRAIWNDVTRGVNQYGTKSTWGDDTQSLHTPPAIGAAASGLVSGIQQMYGGADLLNPKHFITGLVAAGIDASTARVAGGVLGALGGLRPAAQEKLQELGLWGGFIRGSVGSVLGL